ncbi:hypothetical protein ABZV29_24090 [Streptomyces sp. NPDC005236]|uniref:hypothetical protein n=1 Tax=Streptomyces sp. NPDC005236 TaxID=3157028 RepID=UPI0033AB8512
MTTPSRSVLGPGRADGRGSAVPAVLGRRPADPSHISTVRAGTPEREDHRAPRRDAMRQLRSGEADFRTRAGPPTDPGGCPALVIGPFAPYEAVAAPGARRLARWREL